MSFTCHADIIVEVIRRFYGRTSRIVDHSRSPEHRSITMQFTVLGRLKQDRLVIIMGIDYDLSRMAIMAGVMAMVVR
jgi:hypothetical protein